MLLKFLEKNEYSANKKTKSKIGEIYMTICAIKAPKVIGTVLKMFVKKQTTRAELLSQNDG